MASGSKVLHPIVTWAQRKEHIFVTIQVEVKSPKLDVQPDKLVFSGTGEGGVAYGCELEFFAEVEPEGLKQAASQRHVQLLIPKKDKTAEWWPRLLKPKVKHASIKVDFDKWKDEDEVDEAADAGMMGMGGMGGGDFDLNSMMSQMGGMGGMGGMDRPDLGDFEDGPDSDNEELPDLEDDEEKVEEPKASTATASA